MMLSTEYGSDIDAHDVVIRLNDGPTVRLFLMLPRESGRLEGRGLRRTVLGLWITPTLQNGGQVV
jgi:hypothetical protein